MIRARLAILFAFALAAALAGCGVPGAVPYRVIDVTNSRLRSPPSPTP